MSTERLTTNVQEKVRHSHGLDRCCSKDEVARAADDEVLVGTSCKWAGLTV